MTSAAPSGWRVGWGGGATLSPTLTGQHTEVGVCFEKPYFALQCYSDNMGAVIALFLMLTPVVWDKTTWNYIRTLTLMFLRLSWQLNVFPHLTIKAFLSLLSTVVFSSMTSLQKEEFFDLVATAQARRLDDQRAQLEKSQPPKSKGRSFRGSIRQLSFARRPAPAPVPVPVPKEDLYNMILSTQVSNL